MRKCYQFKDQNIYEHGLSVWEYMQDLLEHLWNETPLEKEWKIPTWLYEYKWNILENILPTHIIEEYCIFHDNGKFLTKSIDNNGKIHFHNHAEASYNQWLLCGGNEIAAKCMKLDMIIHTMKDSDIDEFIKNRESITLILSGLAEIHSNAAMFGGMESTNFKIKWKQIDRRGKAICKKLFY